MSGTFELEGFEPISRLGGGGFGDVWLARQTNVDRQVAIKVGHSAIQDETIRLRFDRECKALGRLSGHPNIVDVYTAGSLRDGRPYLVLEYIDGGTLWQRLKKSPLPDSELTSIGTELAAALTEAHSSGVLHRDLKPENILIRSSGEAVLGDFGIARLHDGANTTSAAITASVAYAAPEILSGKRATVASDLYGIGVCLLAAVFRSVPFVQKSDESIHPIINRVLSDEAPDVRRHGVSEPLAALIHSLLAKDPGKRPTSAADLLIQFRTLPPAPLAEHSATRIVTASAAVQTPAPGAANAPYQQPSAAPRPQDAAPGLRNPNPSPAWQAANNTPPPQPSSASFELQQQAAAPVERLTTERGKLRLFALAYVATLIIGGIAAFILITILEGDDGSNDAEQSATATVDDVDIGAESANGLAGLSTQSEDEDAESQGSAGDITELTLPLEVADTSFGVDAETTEQSPGPGATTLCDNRPDTDGLIDWKGQIISTDLGVRTLLQVVSRFESPEAATRYIDEYAGTNDCASWVVDGTGDADDVAYSALQTPPPSFGDKSRRFEVTGQVGDDDRVHSRVLLVQSGSDVLNISLSAPSREQASEVDQLVEVAATRLGYRGT